MTTGSATTRPRSRSSSRCSHQQVEGRTPHDAVAAPRAPRHTSSTCIAVAAFFWLAAHEAREIVDHQVEVIRRECHEAADAALLAMAEGEGPWQRQVLNPPRLLPRLTSESLPTEPRQGRC